MATARRLGFRAFDGYHAGNGVGAAERLGEWTWLREAIGEMLEGERHPDERDWIASMGDFFSAWTGDPDIARAERMLASAIRDHDFQGVRNVSDFLARCAFAAGDATGALDRVEPFFRETPVDRDYNFGFASRYALHAARPDIVRLGLDILGAGPGGAVDHDIEALKAGLAALEGQRDEALALYRSALAGYRAFGLRFSLALTVYDMTFLIGPDDPAVRSVMGEGRAILEGQTEPATKGRVFAAPS